MKQDKSNMERGKMNQKRVWFIYFPICIGIGTGIGALFGNVGVGIAAGSAIGAVLNLIAYYQKRKFVN